MYSNQFIIYRLWIVTEEYQAIKSFHSLKTSFVKEPCADCIDHRDRMCLFDWIICGKLFRNIINVTYIFATNATQYNVSQNDFIDKINELWIINPTLVGSKWYSELSVL